MRDYLRLGVLGLLVAGTPQVQGSETTRFRVLVPENAFVFVAKERMASTGAERLFESPPLEMGRRYVYEISVIHEGQEVVRQVRFQPGRTVVVDFREDCEKLGQSPTPPGPPWKPFRQEWLPKRVYRT